MDFALSEEQQLLAESLRRFLEEECPVTKIRDLVAQEHGHDGGNWKALAELGVAGLLVPEEFGGSGVGTTGPPEMDSQWRANIGFETEPPFIPLGRAQESPASEKPVSPMSAAKLPVCLCAA